jgi:hypothetical protein
LSEQPVGQFLWFVLFDAIHFDAIHYRGLLSTYLRPVGGKVPSIYGPSADERPGGGRQSLHLSLQVAVGLAAFFEILLMVIFSLPEFRGRLNFCDNRPLESAGFG